MIKEEKRFIPSNIMEGMTSISALLAAKSAGVNDRPIHEIWFDRAKKEKKAREFGFLQAKTRELGIPLILTDAAAIEENCIGNTHGGVIALCGERTLPSPTAQNLPKTAFYAILRA